MWVKMTETSWYYYYYYLNCQRGVNNVYTIAHKHLNYSYRHILLPTKIIIIKASNVVGLYCCHIQNVVVSAAVAAFDVVVGDDDDDEFVHIVYTI